MSEVIKEGFVRVSDVAQAYASYGRIPKHILEMAAARGEHIHRIIDDLINDVVVIPARYTFAEKDIRPYIVSFYSFWTFWEDSEILLQEERLYNDDLMITGKPDLLMRKDNKNILVDWKATSAAGKHWEIQASGYMNLIFSAMIYPVDVIWFVRLDREGGKPQIVEFKPDLDLFRDAYELYKRFFMEQTFNLEMD